MLRFYILTGCNGQVAHCKDDSTVFGAVCDEADLSEESVTACELCYHLLLNDMTDS
jgi:hypothetical protein